LPVPRPEVVGGRGKDSSHMRGHRGATQLGDKSQAIVAVRGCGVVGGKGERMVCERRGRREGIME